MTDKIDGKLCFLANEEGTNGKDHRNPAKVVMSSWFLCVLNPREADDLTVLELKRIRGGHQLF
jgi:hypothetical protein